MMRLLKTHLSVAKLPLRAFSIFTTPAVLLPCLLILFLVRPIFSPVQAKTDNAYDLIAAVNQLRAANGLPAYEINGALMAAAQAHSEYQAASGSITHTGAGGSSPKSRAAAAGYGSGAAIFITENIAGGGGMTYQRAVQMWQGDSPHLNTMLGSSYTDVGAGVAYSGNSAYFTLDVGYVSGSPGSSAQVVNNSAQPPAATAIPIQPLVTATAAPDGSVTHKVQSGQTLWSISAIYQVTLPEILALNGFTNETLIFPGDEIRIKPASIITTPDFTPTAVSSTNTPTPRPTRTVAPTHQTQMTEVAMQPEEVAIQRNSTQKTSSNLEDPILYLISALVLGGSTLLIVGNLLKRQSTSNEDD
jgi:uncharacterized protein YkwD